MYAYYFFILGLVNSIMLISIFIVRRKNIDIVKRYGWTYLTIAFPAIFGIILAFKEDQSIRYSIFLFLFLAFLCMEWLLDYFLKVDFREDMKGNLKWAVPYLVLYYAMNYGFIVMPWKTDMTWGIIMLILFMIQIFANLMSHPRKKN